MSVITKKVTFIADEKHVKELKDLLITMVEPSKAEKGCLLYEIFQLKENPREFLVVESWEDEEALKGHQHSAHYKHYKANFAIFCEDKSSDEMDFIV